MIPNYRPWDGLINRLRACDEHVAWLQAQGDDDQPDEAWGSHETDKENGDG